MKMLVNETFQHNGVRRADSTLSMSKGLLLAEIEKGRKTITKKNGDKVERWLSGILQHCIPANDETSDFIEKHSGKKVKPAKEEHDVADDSEEIKDVRQQITDLGKSFHPRAGLKKLKDLLIKVKKEAGEMKEAPKGVEEKIT